MFPTPGLLCIDGWWLSSNEAVNVLHINLILNNYNHKDNVSRKTVVSLSLLPTPTIT